jgi:hypothetical protein
MTTEAAFTSRYGALHCEAWSPDSKFDRLRLTPPS